MFSSVACLSPFLSLKDDGQIKNFVKKLSSQSFRSGQDSNLCGQSPIDFESIALTTRPPLLRQLDFRQFLFKGDCKLREELRLDNTAGLASGSLRIRKSVVEESPGLAKDFILNEDNTSFHLSPVL